MTKDTRIDAAQLEIAGAAAARVPQHRDAGVGEQIYQAIVELHNQGRPASRQRIRDMTGFKMTVVDDHIKRMRNEGLIAMVCPGVFEPVAMFPPDRTPTVTETPEGFVKLEIGDDLVQFTPSEVRRVARMLVGYAMQGGVIQSERDARAETARLDRLEHDHKLNNRRTTELAQKMAKFTPIGQDDMFGTTFPSSGVHQ